MAAIADHQIDARRPEHRPEMQPASAVRFCFPCRPVEPGGETGGRPGPELSFSAVLSPAATAVRQPEPAGPAQPCATSGAKLSSMAAFLTDATLGAVPLATLARMIGCCAFASGTTRAGRLDIALSSSRGAAATARLDRPSFEIEQTAFGAAHILHEDQTLGLYVLEIAPGRSIPAHCHRLMREWELILDDGLQLQDRAVRRGAAFAWPLGHVHGYRNPTQRHLRVLCIDSPRFNPADEVPLDPAPPLAPRAPFAEYPV